MSLVSRLRCSFAGVPLALSSLGLVTALPTVDAQEPRTALREPVHRVAEARVERPEPVVHPLDPALALARDGLVRIRRDVADYSCTLVKRERVKGVLLDTEHIHTEVRNRKVIDGRVVTPFSVYMYFKKPVDIKGREVIFIEGNNNNKLVAHEGGGGLLKLAPSVWLRPEGPIAMRGNRYPITDVGIENLIEKLIERGERDRSVGRPEECHVRFIQNAKINDRLCTVLEIMHPHRPYYDFYIARVFIDDELNLPIRYAAYLWPATEGGAPQLLEEYTYINLKVNIGLADDDFDHHKKFRG